MKKYAQIVFLQGDDALEPFALLRKGKNLTALEYLKNWDYGNESEYDLRDESSAGKADHVFIDKHQPEYVLNWHTWLEYVGLQRIVEAE